MLRWSPAGGYIRNETKRGGRTIGVGPESKQKRAQSSTANAAAGATPPGGGPSASVVWRIASPQSPASQVIPATLPTHDDIQEKDSSFLEDRLLPPWRSDVPTETTVKPHLRPRPAVWPGTAGPLAPAAASSRRRRRTCTCRDRCVSCVATNLFLQPPPQGDRGLAPEALGRDRMEAGHDMNPENLCRERLCQGRERRHLHKGSEWSVSRH